MIVQLRSYRYYFNDDYRQSLVLMKLLTIELTVLPSNRPDYLIEFSFSKATSTFIFESIIIIINNKSQTPSFNNINNNDNLSSQLVHVAHHQQHPQCFTVQFMSRNPQNISRFTEQSLNRNFRGWDLQEVLGRCGAQQALR